MGYDLRMVRKPAATPAGFEPLYEGQPDYWRFNTAGMQAMRQILLNAGMMDGELSPEWPTFPPEGWDHERAYSLLDALENGDTVDGAAPTLQEQEVVLAFMTESSRVREVRSASPGLVPICKFCSNDGWLVTPDECSILARGLRAAIESLGSELWAGEAIGEEEARSWILKFAAWNELAAAHGGYRVS
jgi:hypothetical protein